MFFTEKWALVRHLIDFGFVGGHDAVDAPPMPIEGFREPPLDGSSLLVDAGEAVSVHVDEAVVDLRRGPLRIE